jgi:hypothetical protein
MNQQEKKLELIQFLQKNKWQCLGTTCIIKTDHMA